MMNSAESTFTRRSPESPAMWVILLAGSVLIHLLLVLVIRQMLTRIAQVELVPDPISVELVQPDEQSGQPKVAALNRTTATRDRATRAATRATPTKADPNPAFPSATPSPSPQPPRRASEPPRRSPTTRPSPQTVNSPEPSPKQSSQPAPPVNPPQPSPQQTSEPTPAPTTGSGGGNSGNPPTTPSPDQPRQSGKGLPPPQGGQAAVEVLRFYQTQDLKQQPARPKESTKQVLVSSLLKPGQPIKLRVQLLIDEKGTVVNVENVTLLGTSQGSIDPNRLGDLAKQIFTNWSFEPAQDAPTGQPLQPVFSDLLVEAEVTLR